MSAKQRTFPDEQGNEELHFDLGRSTVVSREYIPTTSHWLNGQGHVEGKINTTILWMEPWHINLKESRFYGLVKYYSQAVARFLKDFGQITEARRWEKAEMIAKLDKDTSLAKRLSLSTSLLISSWTR